jgi:putative transposase
MGREVTGREASPSARVIDSKSVKAAESGGLRGYDAGKEIKGRKRHILTDTEGNLVHSQIHTADIQNRDGAPLVMAEIIHRFPGLRYVLADGVYACEKLRLALRRIGESTVEIVKRSDTANGCAVLPRRWVVERHWDGPAATAASPRTSNIPSPRQPHGCSLHRFSSSPAASQGIALKSDNYESGSRPCCPPSAPAVQRSRRRLVQNGATQAPTRSL